jgi:phage-related protein
MKEIVFFRTRDGKCPVEEFFDALADAQGKKVAWVLRIIRDINPIPAQYLKKLVNTDDIREIRVGMGNNIFRFLGFFDGLNFIVLTNAFQKKTQKTPRNEIRLAEERKREYLSRRNRRNG